MRLSWYSDTGIAVFSIWQGGTCTGTFRLPLDDLSRLMESLHRGAPGAGQPAGDNSGPAALGGRRPRLAIGAGSSAAPFTGMMATLTEDQAAAYRTMAANGKRTGGLAKLGPRGSNGAGATSGPQARDAGQQYGDARQYGTPQPGSAPRYDSAQQYPAEQPYGVGRQYEPDQYGPDQYGTAQQYGQYQAQSPYGGDAGGQPRQDTDGAGDRSTDYLYTTKSGGQYGGYTGTGRAGLGQQATVAQGADQQPAPSYPTGAQDMTQPGGYGGAAQYQAPQQGEPAPGYDSGPQAPFSFSPAGQQSYAENQGGPQGYGGPGQADNTLTSEVTGPQSPARYGAQAYQAPAAPAFDVGQPFEARQQSAPARDEQAYTGPGYPGQGYRQQVYEQPAYQETGYPEQGYAVSGQAEQASVGTQSTAGAFGNSSYGSSGYQEAGQGTGQPQDYAYGGLAQQPDHDYRFQVGQQGAPVDASSAEQGYASPQQWPDHAGSDQLAATGGYSSSIGGVAALSAPVPPDSGVTAAPPQPAMQQGGGYGTPQVPEADRYAASHREREQQGYGSYGEQQGYGQASGYQATAAPGAGAAGAVGGMTAAGGYDTGMGGTARGDYQPLPSAAGNGYGYGTTAYTANGYGDGDHAAASAAPSTGYGAVDGQRAGAYPAPAASASGYAANGNGNGTAGHWSSGYGAANGYGANGYGANGYSAADSYPAYGNASGEHMAGGAQLASAPAPSDAYPSPSGYDGGASPVNDGMSQATGQSASPMASPNGAYQAPPDYGQASYGTGPTFIPNGAPAAPGGSAGTGYDANQHAGAQAYQDYANSNGAGHAAEGGSANGYPANGYPANGYSSNGHSNGYAANGSGYASGYPADGNGYGTDGRGYGGSGSGYGVNGNAVGYGAPNGGGANFQSADGNGYPAAHEAATSGYHSDSYASGDYPPAPGDGAAGQADPGQPQYWQPRHPSEGNWP